jgi:hypothetical protein
VLVADWLVARLSGKPFKSERWFVELTGRIAKVNARTQRHDDTPVRRHRVTASLDDSHPYGAVRVSARRELRELACAHRLQRYLGGELGRRRVSRHQSG